MSLSSLPEEIKARLEAYEALLHKWQKAINLVGPKTLEDSWRRHFIDSAQIESHISQNAVVADLGSGAGFPGMVLAMIRPDLKIHLIESDQKKAQFLWTVSRETQTEIHIHNDRIESILEDLPVSVITARALSSLKDLLGFTAPLIEKQKKMQAIFLKGKRAEEEIREAQKTYAFDLQKHPSATDPDSTVLILSRIQKR